MSSSVSDAPPAQVQRADRIRTRIARLRSRTDGAAGVWIPAAAVGTLLAGLILWQLLIPRSYYTGTNSVGVRSVVANLNVGDRLCIPGLNLPADTGAVQLAVFAHRPTFAARLSVSVAGR